MNGPVSWGSYPGEFLESLMAVLVAQEEPNTLRRVPARGDGGIDLMVPVDDGYEVQQVKGFTGRIGTSERRQIAESWDTVRTDPRLDRPIKGYRLVVPVDLTPAEQHWFEELVSDAPWPATWRGRVHWDSLAAKHPHVIDYFCFGGRDRIAKRSLALQSAATDPTQPLTVLDVAGRLGILLSALNKDDPHYRYEIRTSDRAPLRSEHQECAFVYTQQLSDGQYLSTLVISRHRYSEQDSPITGTLEITIPTTKDAVDIRAAVRAFEHFGRALDLPEGAVSGTLLAPGGLSSEFQGASGWIGAVPTGPVAMRIIVVGQDNEIMAELPLSASNATFGLAGGAEVRLADTSEFLTGLLQISPPDDEGIRTATISFSTADLPGRPVMEILPTLRTLACLIPGNELQLRPQYGARVLASSELDKSFALLTSAGLRHIEDLGVLQQYASDVLHVPDEVDPVFATRIRELVRMIEGEQLDGTWDEVSICLTAGATRANVKATFSTQGPLGMEEEIIVSYDDQEIPLGTFTTVLYDVRVADEQPTDETLSRLTPAKNVRFSRRFGPMS